MKRILFIIILVFLFINAGAADLADFYSGFSSLGSDTFISDKNTGLTIFPTLLIPSGGLYEGMGTAFTAVASDASFLEANPAGSSTLQYTEVALNHNNWIADSNMEGVVYTTRFNNLGIGIGGKFLYVPFIGYNRWGEELSSSYYSETVATVNVSYNFFSSYYFSGLSLGANLKAAYRNVPAVIRENQSILTLMTDIGFLTRFNLAKFYASRDRNFSFGGVVKNIGINALGEPLPSVATAGIAYSPIRPLIISLDFNYPFSFTTPSDQWEKWNIASGMNLVLTDFFSIHSGFSYRGSNPRFTIGSEVTLQKISITANYTLDMTTQLTSMDKFTVQMSLNMGDKGRYGKAKKVDDYYIAGLKEYANGNYSRAIKFWEAALEIDPTFQPAAENLTVAKNAIDLQKKMEAINQVEK